MIQTQDTISKRTLVFRYIVLTVMTFMLTTMVVLSFWFVFTWENYMLHHPGLWVSNIEDEGDSWGLVYIRETGHLIVRNVDSSSAATAAGITEGDTIVGINGTKLSEKPEAFFGAFIGIKPGDLIDLELIRNGLFYHKQISIERNYRIDLPKGYLGVTSYWSEYDSNLARSLPQQGIFIKSVASNGPAENAGIKPGDIFLRYDNVRLTSDRRFTTQIENSATGSTVPVEILRRDTVHRLSIVVGSKDPLSFHYVNVQIRATLGTIVWLYYNGYTFALVLLLIVGAVIGWIRPKDQIAFACSVMFLGFGGAMYVTDLPFSASLPIWVTTVGVCCSLLSMGISIPMTLWVFSVFPNSSTIGRLFLQWRWIFFAFYGIVSLYAFLNFLAGLYSWRLPGLLASYYSMQSWIYVPFVLGFLALLFSQRIATQDKNRNRLRIIEYGMIIGLLPMILMICIFNGLIPEQWNRDFGGLFMYFFVIGISSIPISFAYTILTRKVFDIRFIIRKGLRYLLLSKGALLVEGIIVFLIVIQVLSYAGTEFLNSPTAVGGVAVASTLTVIAVVGRVNRKLMPAIDRRFFREALDVKRLLMELNEKLSEMKEREKILQQTATTVLKALHPTSVVMLLRYGKSDEFRCELTLENGRAKQSMAVMDQSVTVAEMQTQRHGMDRDTPDSSGVVTPVHDQVLKADDPIIKQMEEKKGWVIVYPENLDLEKEEDRRLSAVNCELLIAIKGSSGLVGFMGLGGKLSEEPYSKEDRELLMTVAREMGLALENAKLLEVAKREAEYSKELEIARQVQQNLFPTKLPTPSGWEFAGICKPAKAVGGDYYDIFEPVLEKVIVALGDVSGKGLGASFVMSGVHSTIRTNAEKSIDNPVGLINELNKYLLGSTSKNIFVTLFLGIIDLGTGKLSYVNCGHPPALVVRKENGEIEKLTRTGLALGMMSTAKFTQGTSTLTTGDSLIVYSDGITEAMNEKEEFFDEERLVKVVNTASKLEAASMMEEIMKSVSEFIGQAEQSDDVSIIVARRELETA